MTLTDIPNHKQLNIMKWLEGAVTTKYFEYEIFLEYNPDYPNKIKGVIRYD